MRSRMENWATVLEYVLALLLYPFLLYTFASAFIRLPNIIDALYVCEQTIIMIFLLSRRRANAMTDRPFDVFAALAGTVLPLIAQPPVPPAIAPIPVCAILMILGITLHVGAKLSLRRSIGIVPADRGIKVEGAYRLIRHPMYMGYIIVHTGLLLSGPALWNIAVFGATWIFFLIRIHAEERVLSRNAEYQAFCKKTRFRLVPGVY